MVNFWQKLPKPFTALAPMEGVTDFVFREVVAECLPKPDVMFTEFTNVDGLTSDGFKKTILRLKFNKKQRPMVAQIWGSNPDNFYKSAQIIKKLKFDGIDINIGCPDKEVVKTGGGSILINNPDLVGKIITATKKGAGGLPLSVKTRIGFKTIATETWFPFLLRQKLDAISIHFRTAKEMSNGEPHWDEAIKIIKMRNIISPKTLIIGNGDVLSSVEALEMHKKYKVDGVMIGRGVFDNPWVFDPNKTEHTTLDYINLLQKHFDYFEKENPDPKILKKRYTSLKKFFKMYINNFPGANLLRIKLMETKTIEEAREILKNVIASEAKQSLIVN